MLRDIWRNSGIAVCVSATIFGVAGFSSPGAMANEFEINRASVRGEILHLLQSRHDRDADRQSSQAAPAVIPKDELDLDPSGLTETYQPAGPTVTKNNAFFQNLGTNGRTCFSCHQPDQGWGVSAQSIQLRFLLSAGLDPIFRPVDGAVCPDADTSNIFSRAQAYKLLLSRGVIRIGLPLPPDPEFSIVGVTDPNGCNSKPSTGLTSPTTGMVSVYRRPLPSTNLRMLSTVMWDGREGGLLPPASAPAGQPTLADDLAQQAIDATTGHAQASAAPTAAQVAQIVNFEMGLSTAQVYDTDAHALNTDGAKGGAVALSQVPFYLGINDPFGLNPAGTPFTAAIFTLYDAWTNLTHGDVDRARAAVARGQKVFNTKPIKITGVAGINDAVNARSFTGACATCHDTPNGGDHSVKAPLNINIAGAGADAPPALNISGLPVFKVTCSVATYFRPANTPFYVTDLGRAMQSGKCADVGKTKGPILRGLASRAPYFHNGAAATLMDAVNFYDQRFDIGLTKQEKSDLVTFLKTL
jgi:cytochrome c peroxidase